MREIKLNHGQVALVDDEDFDFISQWKWRAEKGSSGIWYAKRTGYETGKKKSVRMHRQLTGNTYPIVDHADRNGLNNQRHNLRNATPSQNIANSKIRDSISGLKGVHWHKPNKKWIAKIRIHGKDKHIGCFEDKNQAHKAYEIAAKAAFGEFARTS